MWLTSSLFRLLPVLWFASLTPGLAEASEHSTAPASTAANFLSIRDPNLSQALLNLAQQAGVSIVFPKNATDGYPSEVLEGVFSLEQALQRLLGDACLTYQVLDNRLITIRAGCAPTIQKKRTPVFRSSIVALEHAPSGVEEILVRERYVTGSRIRIPDLANATPIDVIERPDIELAGNQDLGELLRFLPSVAGNATSTLVTNGGDGTATVTLRGLPASNTLVLLNGRRTNTDPFLARAVDLNTLPIGLIDRIEVLKDGASALYGSDAIAGVVNVVTRKDYDGIEANSYYGAASRGDLETFNSNLLFGRSYDRFRFTAGGSYYDQQPLWSRDRSRSRSADDRPRGGIDKRSSATAPARIRTSNGFVTLASNQFDGSDPSQFRAVTSEDRFNYRDFTSAIVPSRRWSLFTNFSADLNDSLELYLEGLYTDTRATNTLAPAPIFTGFESRDFTVAADNSFNPFGEPLFDVRRRVLELGSRRTVNASRSARLVAGLSGTTERFHWTIAYSENQTRGEEQLRNLLEAEKLQRAVGGPLDCVGACVPLNLFGPPGSITPEMIEFLKVGVNNRAQSKLRNLILDLDFPLGSLAAGDIELASGIEYRKESLVTHPDELVQDQRTVGGANFGATRGSRDIFEAYAEVLIPVWRDQPFGKLLDLRLATRVSNYSDFGTTANPRIALRYSPFDSLMFRASYSNGFRAPALHELHASENQSFEFLSDPCREPQNVGILPGCSLASDPTLVQFLTVGGGNPDLEPEQARTYTAGLVWKPVFLAGLQASLDLYRIKEKDVVATSSQFVVNENARTLRFAERVVRNADGNINRILSSSLNLGKRDVGGLDFTLEYQLPETPVGFLEITLNATHIAHFKEQLDPESNTIDKAGTFSDEASAGSGALPDWKANLGLHWRNQHTQFSYSIHYVSDLKETIPILDTQRTISSWDVHNLQLSYLGEWSLWTRISLGINNLFDKAPPFSAAAFNDSYDSRTYDITGRYLYLQLNKTL